MLIGRKLKLTGIGSVFVHPILTENDLFDTNMKHSRQFFPYQPPSPNSFNVFYVRIPTASLKPLTSLTSFFPFTDDLKYSHLIPSPDRSDRNNL